MHENTPGLFRKDAKATSRVAAFSVAGITGAQRRQVYAAIQCAPSGLTDEEGIAMTGLSPSSYRPRRVELDRGGFVVQAGTRRTASGRSAIVWAAAGNGGSAVASGGVGSTEVAPRPTAATQAV